MYGRYAVAKSVDKSCDPKIGHIPIAKFSVFQPYFFACFKLGSGIASRKFTVTDVRYFTSD